MSNEERLQYQADVLNSRPGEMKHIDCPKCLNRGYIAIIRDGELVMQDCSCMVKRRAMRRMYESGLSDMITRYTFPAFQTAEPWQQEALDLCKRYAETPRGKWLVITGTPGTGKTHLCTAVCGALIKAGCDVRYLLWRAQAPTLKAYANSPEYEKKIEPFKTVKVLYIDDFLKGAITEADKNLAFDLLNARYNRTDLITILSSELTIEQILDEDQALGSRIYERADPYIKTVGRKNWRLQ